MKTYASKEELYRDFIISIKFKLRYDVHRAFYADMYAVLAEGPKWKVKRFQRDVALLSSQNPGKAIGAFVEIPVSGKDGKSLGSRCVLLGHESGPEWWIDLGIKLGAGWMLRAIWDQVKERTYHCVNVWLVDRGYTGNPIEYVEIRTHHKGVMRILFDDLQADQLACLVERFDNVAHIGLLNADCFQGLLFEPESEYLNDGIGGL